MSDQDFEAIRWCLAVAEVDWGLFLAYWRGAPKAKREEELGDVWELKVVQLIRARIAPGYAPCVCRAFCKVSKTLRKCHKLKLPQEAKEKIQGFLERVSKQEKTLGPILTGKIRQELETALGWRPEPTQKRRRVAKRRH